jgi:ribonuclease VapC
MVVASSAIIAALTDEPEAGPIRDCLCAYGEKRMSAFNLFECRVVLNRRHGLRMVILLDDLLTEAGIAIDPFDDDQAVLAFAAYRRFGKGTGHPAGLNLGDCIAYSLATSRNLPLLYMGDDFAKTDVAAVL